MQRASLDPVSYSFNPSSVELFYIHGSRRWRMNTPLLWNLSFHIFYEVETWTNGSPWQMETMEDVITLVTWVKFNLKTRNNFQNRVDDVIYQLHFSRGILSLSVNFISSQEAEKIEVADFFHEKLCQ